MPQCMNCYTDLETDDIYDVQIETNHIRTCHVGYCPKCGKPYQWEEIYEYSKFENVTECEE